MRKRKLFRKLFLLFLILAFIAFIIIFLGAYVFDTRIKTVIEMKKFYKWQN